MKTGGVCSHHKSSYDVSRVNNVQNAQDGPWLLSRRFQVALMGFLGTVLLYLQRASMSVAIVCMTNDVTDTSSAAAFNVTANVTNTTTSFFEDQHGHILTPDVVGIHQGELFTWSRGVRGWVLSSYYIGYILTQLPGGWVAKRYGAKWTLQVGMGILTILTLVTPLSAGVCLYLLMVVQALKGAASGAYYPVFYHMLGAWSLPTERSVMVAIFGSGAPIGTVLSFVLSGYLCDNGFAGGWPSIFYTFGAASAIWCFLWASTVYETPEVHPRISDVERELFASANRGVLSIEKQGTSVPWRNLLTTWPLYAIFFTDVCYSFGWFVALNSLPQYLKDAFDFDITQNSLYNALPYISNWIVSITGSVIADRLLQKNVLNRTTVRKLFQTLGLVPSAGCALGVAFLTSSVPRLVTVFLLSLWVGFLGFTRSAADVNLMELAPAYAGIIMGIDQTVTSVPAILAPVFVGLVTPTGASMEWRNVFLLTAGVFVLGWLVYVIFTTAKEMEWSKGESMLKSHSLENMMRVFSNVACAPVTSNSTDRIPEGGATGRVLDVVEIVIVSDGRYSAIDGPV